MNIQTVLNHLEKQLNWSLKENKFIVVPEELHGVNLQPLWDQLEDEGYEVQFAEEFTVAVIRKDTSS